MGKTKIPENSLQITGAGDWLTARNALIYGIPRNSRKGWKYEFGLCKLELFWGAYECVSHGTSATSVQPLAL
jgi:hypothetical protein